MTVPSSLSGEDLLGLRYVVSMQAIDRQLTLITVFAALVALGYGQTDAAAVIAPMEDSLAVDELIRRALKSFTRGK